MLLGFEYKISGYANTLFFSLFFLSFSSICLHILKAPWIPLKRPQQNAFVIQPQQQYTPQANSKTALQYQRQHTIKRKENQIVELKK